MSNGSRTTNITGSSNVNVESTLTNVQQNINSTLNNVQQMVGAMPGANDADRKELQKLVEELKAALQNPPKETADAAEAVAEQTKALIETASKEKPNKTMLQTIGGGLKAAADFLKDAIPSAVTIVGQIARVVGRIYGVPL